jgi:hypothetical protein
MYACMRARTWTSQSTLSSTACAAWASAAGASARSWSSAARWRGARVSIGGGGREQHTRRRARGAAALCGEARRHPARRISAPAAPALTVCPARERCTGVGTKYGSKEQQQHVYMSNLITNASSPSASIIAVRDRPHTPPSMRTRTVLLLRLEHGKAERVAVQPERGAVAHAHVQRHVARAVRRAHRLLCAVSRGRARGGGTHARAWTISFCASPSRRYERRTEIETTCPCGGSPLAFSSSSSSLHIHQPRAPTRRQYTHLAEDVAHDAPRVVLRDVRHRRPREEVVEVELHAVVLRQRREVARLHPRQVADLHARASAPCERKCVGMHRTRAGRIVGNMEESHGGRLRV